MQANEVSFPKPLGFGGTQIVAAAKSLRYSGCTVKVSGPSGKT